jgi:DNA/RNA endonuclease G (NUC1)
MVADTFVFNGIAGATGSYLTGPLSAKAVCTLAQGEPPDPKELASAGHRDIWPDAVSARAREALRVPGSIGPAAGVDPKDLASSGWGVVFPHEVPAGVKEALQELLAHRKTQAARERERLYKEYTGANGVRSTDTKQSFLTRNGVPLGSADPERLPYYLLLVGSPEAIPYGFQYNLDVDYAVGRLWFETLDGKPDLDAFARYARSVVEAEKGQLALARRAAFVGVQNDDDAATGLSAVELVRPLTAKLAEDRPTWEYGTFVKEGARKADLVSLLNGPDVPALLFTAGHGMGFPNGDRRQVPHQGALLCQDWSGPIRWGQKPIPPDHYLAADDISDGARLLGLLAFHFASYAAGTPAPEDFPHLKLLGRGDVSRPFVARLPQRLLSHPKGGALAVVGHAERAWSYSFPGRPSLGRAFLGALLGLLDGFPVGYAMENFGSLYAALSNELVSEVQDIKYGKTPDDLALAALWTSTNDARSCSLLGDPAVRLAVGAGGSAPDPRPVIELVTAPSPMVGPPPSPSPAVPPAAEVLGKGGPGLPFATLPPVEINVPVQAGQNVRVMVPLYITLRAEGPAQVGTIPEPPSSSTPAAPRTSATSIDPEYNNREGYDPEFLGAGALRVPLPELSSSQKADAARVSNPEPEASPFELKYHHFSVVVNGKRRMAFFTAVNIDGRLARLVRRALDKWVFDPRIRRDEQVGNELYGRPFDRGHLVRRLDPAWGRTYRIAKVASDDVFHYTNCTPQHQRFNEGKNLWAGLEDYVLKKATDERRRLTVFSGPIFAADDPVIRDVQVPTRFWKVMVLAMPKGRLSAVGFLVSQEALLHASVSETSELPRTFSELPSTFQVPVRQLEMWTGLDFGPLASLDPIGGEPAAPDKSPARGPETFEDIRLSG